ncbi:15307_t:CDS:2, partial [Gigaspora margarita]
NCIKEETYASSDKYPLEHLLIYYEGYQSQYTHLQVLILAYAYINLLEILRRFEKWTPNHMGEKKFLRVVIWDEPLLFFEEMPHDWLKKRADYYEEVLTDYWAKCSRLQELKKKIQCQNNRVQSDLFCEALLVAKKWKYLETEWKLSDLKKLVKKELDILEDLIKELSTEPKLQVPLIRKENAISFNNLYNNITNSEMQNEITNRDVVTNYYL